MAMHAFEGEGVEGVEGEEVYCHDPDFARISHVYLITGFTLVADQQFVVECGYK